MNIIPAKRVTRLYTQQLIGSVEQVFPLLCPVREADWIEGWMPALVVSDSGVAEEDCVFITPDMPSDAIWYITRHEANAGLVEMLKITPGLTACRLRIQLTPQASGCAALVSYRHTSLGTAQGDAFVEAFTEAYYSKFMQDWEARINHYLQHGQPLVVR